MNHHDTFCTCMLNQVCTNFGCKLCASGFQYLVIKSLKKAVIRKIFTEPKMEMQLIVI